MWRCSRGMLRRGKDICFSSGEVVAIETGMALIGVGVASGIVSEIVWLVEGGLCWLSGVWVGEGRGGYDCRSVVSRVGRE